MTCSDEINQNFDSSIDEIQASNHTSCLGDANLDEKHKEGLRALKSPGMIDQCLRQSLSTIWILIPDSKRKSRFFAELVRERIEHILNEYAEDCKLFGLDDDQRE